MHAAKPPGPLFIVGVPRSGTKLLRGMLNQHPSVRLPDIETEFLPYWIARWNDFGPLHRPAIFERFYRECLELPFFMQLAERGVEVASAEWFAGCRSFTPAGTFEALIRCVVSAPPHDRSIVWGDKSPSYVRHVPLLVKHFPEARVIHIIRDVRDCSLSMHEAWGKNVFRAAQRWQDDVSRCRADGRRFPASYREIRYEDLLTDPKSIMQELCSFIGIEFEEGMLGVSPTNEDRGDARGSERVVSGNVAKYRSRMKPAVMRRIEPIACETLRALGYPCDYAGSPVRIPDWQLRLLQVSDGVGLVRSTLSRRGLAGSVRFFSRYSRTSGNRIG